MLNKVTDIKYIMLTIKQLMKVLQWSPPARGLVEFKRAKDKKNKGNHSKYKNIKKIIASLAKLPKITCKV